MQRSDIIFSRMFTSEKMGHCTVYTNEYKDEIGIFHTPAEILEDQLGNIYPVAVYKRK